MAGGGPGRLVDPVNAVEKATEGAGSGVHQRQTWTNGVKKRTLTSLSQKFQTFETIYGRKLSILVQPTVAFSHRNQVIVHLYSYTELFICLQFRYFKNILYDLLESIVQIAQTHVVW